MRKITEQYAEQINFLTSIDPRVKLSFVVICLGVISAAQEPRVLYLFGLSLFLLLLSCRVSLRYLCLRLIPGLGLILMVNFIKFLSYESFSWETLSLMGAKVTAGIMVLLFLATTTTISKLIFAAQWFRLPPAILEIITLCYRYIFVLMTEISLVYRAQKLRFAYSSWHHGLRAIGSLGGITLIRAFERSESLYRSMSSRGYQGDLQVNYQSAFRTSDLLTSLFFSMVVVLLIKTANPSLH